MKWLRQYLARIKGLESSVDLSDWNGPELATLVRVLLIRRSRGALLCLRGVDAGAGAMCERDVRIVHGRHLKAGKALNLEEGCEIVALARQGIAFGERCTVGRFAVIRPTNVLLDEAGEGLSVGDHSNIGAYSYIGCSGHIRIGNNVMTGPRINLLAENHNFEDRSRPIKAQGVHRSSIVIGDDCWIGANVTIVAGVRIGEGSVIAAGAVVTRDIPAGSIAAGIPAKVLRKRGGEAP